MQIPSSEPTSGTTAVSPYSKEELAQDLAGLRAQITTGINQGHHPRWRDRIRAARHEVIDPRIDSIGRLSTSPSEDAEGNRRIHQRMEEESAVIRDAIGRLSGLLEREQKEGPLRMEREYIDFQGQDVVTMDCQGIQRLIDQELGVGQPGLKFVATKAEDGTAFTVLFPMAMRGGAPISHSFMVKREIAEGGRQFFGAGVVQPPSFQGSLPSVRCASDTCRKDYGSDGPENAVLREELERRVMEAVLPGIVMSQLEEKDNRMLSRLESGLGRKVYPVSPDDLVHNIPDVQVIDIDREITTLRRKYGSGLMAFLRVTYHHDLIRYIETVDEQNAAAGTDWLSNIGRYTSD